MIYIKTQLLMLVVYFIASFFERTNFMAFGWALIAGLIFFGFLFVKEEMKEEVRI
ncbi:hypothetical protein [Macrococcus equi]|uniref:hypothetical protein n=1 Tax=Macrococcus equi TaxID=3395462 RepID=UPI0039BE4414